MTSEERSRRLALVSDELAADLITEKKLSLGGSPDVPVVDAISVGSVRCRVVLSLSVLVFLLVL